MIRILIFLAGAALVGLAAFWFLSEPVEAQICPVEDSRTAPSGRTLALCNVLYEVQPNNDIWAVVRVVDSGFTPNGGQEDHDWVCETWGIDALDKDPRPSRIVVQIMAAPFERGEPTPEIAQSIEAYSEANGTCQWELL